MPELPELEYLIDDFFELGMYESTGFSGSVFSYQEIESWARITSINLCAWEVFALRELSRAYIDQASKSEDEHCSPPYIHEIEATPDVRLRVNNFFRDFARNRSAKKDVVR